MASMREIVALELLRGVPLFSDVPAQMLEVVAANAGLLSRKKGA